MDLQITGLKVDVGAGPGSRGGRVIGKTKSGKPIYSSHGHRSHSNFTASDHIQAANVHKNLAGSIERPIDQKINKNQEELHRASAQTKFFRR